MSARPQQPAERCRGHALMRGPLTLIHTNNSPKPVSMRVPARLTLENLTPRDLDTWLDFLGSPVGYLLLKRRADAR
jgi:hypothetical protein